MVKCVHFASFKKVCRLATTVAIENLSKYLHFYIICTLDYALAKFYGYRILLTFGNENLKTRLFSRKTLRLYTHLNSLHLRQSLEMNVNYIVS